MAYPAQVRLVSVVVNNSPIGLTKNDWTAKSLTRLSRVVCYPVLGLRFEGLVIPASLQRI